MPGLATPRALSPARVRTDPGFSEDSRFAHSVAAASPRIRDASRSAQLRERQIRTPGIRGRGKRSGLRARIHRVFGRRCSTRLSTTTPHLNSTGTETNYRRPERDEEQHTGADGIRIRVRPQAGHGQENDRRQRRPADLGDDRAEAEQAIAPEFLHAPILCCGSALRAASPIPGRPTGRAEVSPGPFDYVSKMTSVPWLPAATACATPIGTMKTSPARTVTDASPSVRLSWPSTTSRPSG